MTFILGFTVVPVALWVAMSVDWPLWLHAIVWTVVILGLSLGMLRPAKAYLMALQFRHRSSEYDLPDDLPRTRGTDPCLRWLRKNKTDAASVPVWPQPSSPLPPSSSCWVLAPGRSSGWPGRTR